VDDLVLRPVTEDDLEVLVEFFAAPHVARWWHEEATLEAVTAKYAAPQDAVVLLAVVDGRPVGMGQHYLWSEEDAAAYGLPAGSVGIDYLLGHAHDCDRGLGTRLVRALVAHAPPGDVWVTPEEANGPSCRVLDKNGFELMAVKQCHVPDEPWAGPTALYRLDARLRG
jgi:aminoglycoside 6'-N-acetyltransferase